MNAVPSESELWAALQAAITAQASAKKAGNAGELAVATANFNAQAARPWAKFSQPTSPKSP